MLPKYKMFTLHAKKVMFFSSFLFLLHDFLLWNIVFIVWVCRVVGARHWWWGAGRGSASYRVGRPTWRWYYKKAEKIAESVNANRLAATCSPPLTPSPPPFVPFVFDVVSSEEPGVSVVLSAARITDMQRAQKHPRITSCRGIIFAV